MGKICILELDINGAKQIYDIKYPANYIAILPPEMDSLKHRLIRRGTESEEVIEKRLNSGVEEIEEIKNSRIFNQKIVNNDLETAYFELKSSISKMYPNFKLVK